MKIGFAAVCLSSVWVLSGCNATTGGGVSEASENAVRAIEATACLSGDHAVANSSLCLMDDAACYPIADGSWCTGPRTSTCPAGSEPLPAELPCPEGARCFAQSESLQCVIGG